MTFPRKFLPTARNGSINNLDENANVFIAYGKLKVEQA